jgi:hypothetical protein
MVRDLFLGVKWDISSILDIFYPLVIKRNPGGDLDDAHHRPARCP